jgi:ABC-type sugar transport system ATPase subunit
LVKTVRARGIGIVFITHNARHAMLVGDHFVVLNRGAVAAAFNRGEKSREECSISWPAANIWSRSRRTSRFLRKTAKTYSNPAPETRGCARRAVRRRPASPLAASRPAPAPRPARSTAFASPPRSRW